MIHEVTSIPIDALAGVSLNEFSLDERMRWSERRSTRRVEDQAYCLLGLLGNAEDLLTPKFVDQTKGLISQASPLLTSLSKADITGLLDQAGPLLKELGKLDLEGLLKSLEPLLSPDLHVEEALS